MEIVILVGISAVFFALLESNKIWKSGMFMSFFIIFIFLIIRIDFGNDYWMYYYFFDELDHDYVTYSSLNLYDDHFEIGWRVLNKTFSYLNLNFNSFITFLSLINVLVIYRFIKKYVPEEYYWFAVFLYVFNSDFLLIHLSAIRQMLAIMMVLFTIELVIRRKYFWFLIVLYITYTLHTSSLFLLILIPISMLDLKYSLRNFFILIFIYFALFLLGSFFGDLVNLIVGNYFDRYSTYTSDEGAVTSGLGLMVNFIFMASLFYAKKYIPQDKQFFINVSIISILLGVLAIKVMMVYRLNMYFMPFTLISFPLMLYYLKDFIYKTGILLLIMAFYLYSFYNFFYSEIYSEFYMEYHTYL